MATITYIKETKQTVSAMKGLIDYCCQEKKTYDSDKPETEIEFSDIDELLDVDVQGVYLSEIITEVEVTWRNI